MPTLERVETTQSNENNQATENEMIFHYFTFSKNKLMKNAFQFLFSFQNENNSLPFSNVDAIVVFKR